MDGLPTEIRVMTLNCWGLKYISKLRSERLLEIGRRIAAADPPPQIVALQECWCRDDYLAIRRETRAVLPHGKFYHAGAFGAGLVILSCWPLEESTMFRYPLNGRPQAFYHGDWYVGKGVAVARIRYGPAREHVIEVLNTHTHAPYEPEHRDSYLAHRIAQVWELAKLARAAAERGHLVVALGDFNTVPRSLPHRIITSLAPLRDAWRVLHPDSALGQADHPAERARRRPIPTAAFNLAENGVGSDTVLNTWRWPKSQQARLGRGKPHVEVPLDTVDPAARRLDYVFAGTGHASRVAGDAPSVGAWYVRDARVGMVDVHEELGCSVSDHFAVEATLAWDPPSSSESGSADAAAAAAAVSPPVNSTTDEKDAAASSPADNLPPAHQRSTSAAALDNGAYLQSPTTSERAAAVTTSLGRRPRPPPEDEDPLPLATYDEILSIVAKYRRRETTMQRRMYGGFFASLAAAVACLVAVWFVPHNFVAFILMLVAVLALPAGCVSGLIALLFVGGELRALDEFEWEVRNAREAIGGDGGGGGDELAKMW